MSSLADCHNHSTSAPMLESDNDDENEYDSSYNKQNESMMHKVKDVVSKLLHPSFLFSANNDTDRSKRKRSGSAEEKNNAEQKLDRTNTDSHTTYHRALIIKDNEPQMTDDDDNNSRDVPLAEQPTKRRRTANYQHILSTDSHHEDERTSPPLTSTNSFISSTNTTPILRRTSIEQNYSERINRLTSSKQRFNIPSTYRGLTSNYDPSKSPLFSAGNRKTAATTNLNSNEFSANYLLANSLINRSQASTSMNQQSSATLTNPLSNQRQISGVNYSSINSRRLPYIERLRRRTLQDCIRLNRTMDNEPLSVSIIEEHKSTTASPVAKRTKAPEKECGIQCDISIVEPSKKIQRIFPPADIQHEALSAPTTDKIQSFSQTNSSITTVQKEQPPIPIVDITKPKVLGNVTPFSWPKFARAQEEYAKKNPEKCRADAVVPSIIHKTNVHTTSTMFQQTNTSTSTMPKSSFSSSRPTESIWKCPCCTKEHSAQTASCSLCHGINPNYKKLSTIEPTVTVAKEQVPSNNVSTVLAKEPSIPTPVTPIINQTTTKENVVSISPAVTTSAISSTYPSFGTTPVAFFSATTKENPVTANTTASITTTSTIPLFTTAPIVLSRTTEQNTVSTVAPFATSFSMPIFGVAPIPIATEKSAPANPPLLFGMATSKENAVTANTLSSFPITTLDKPLTTSASNSFQIGPSLQSFASVPSTSLNTVLTSSAVPSFVGMTPSLSTSTLLGPFGSTPITTIPVASTVSSNQSPSFTFAPTTSAPSFTTSSATTPNLFGTSMITPVSSTTTATPLSFSMPSTTSAFAIPGSFSFASTATTVAPPAFGNSSFSFAPTSTTPSNPTFGFAVSSPPRSFVPVSIPSMNTITAPPPFGTMAPFGTGALSTDRAPNSFSSFSPVDSSKLPPTYNFGVIPNTTSNTIQTPAASIMSTSGFSFAPQLSTVPVFGAGPSALSSSGISNAFNFGLAPATSTSNAPFSFPVVASLPDSNNSFSAQGFPGATDDGSNLFNIGSGGSQTNATRPILKARRRPRN